MKNTELFSFLSKGNNNFRANMSQYPIECHFTDAIVRNTLTNGTIIEICTEYINGIKDINIVDKHFTNFKAEYISATVAYYSRYIDQNEKKTINNIIYYWHTWDSYAVGLIFLRSLNQMIKQNMINVNNAIIKQLYMLVIKTIHPNPNKRPSIHAIEKNMIHIFFGGEYNKHSNSLFNI
jgi:hypothetical protein